MNAGYWVAIGLVALGIILFFYLSSRKKYRDLSAANNYDAKKKERLNPKEHYKEIRDKLSLRELASDKFDEVESFGINNIHSILVAIITIVIIIFLGTTILSTFNEELVANSASANVTDSTIESMNSLAQFFPIIFIFIILGLVISVIARLFIGGNSYDK